MFNLEASITEWRKQMLANGIQAPVPLEELESHLREDVARRIAAGQREEQAFELAAQQIGGAGLIKTEFKKIQRNQRLKSLIILAALFGSVFGGAMVLPALGRWQHTGVLVMGPLILGAALACVAGAAALYGISRYRGARGRRLIGIAIIGAGAFYEVPLLQAFLLQDVCRAGWLFCIVMAVASLGFYGMCFHLNRLGRAYS